jgi:CheY-like chemotaxis protein
MVIVTDSVDIDWRAGHDLTTPKKILIVEDEQDIAQLVKHYLEKEGFHSNIAKTGLEALNLAASEHPDLERVTK